MTEDEAARAGVENRRFYFRVENGKANLAPPPADAAEWYRLESVDLGNDSDGMPGDSVGVVTRWAWPDAFDGVSVSDLRKVQAAIAAGRWRENAQAKDWAGYAVASVLNSTRRTGRTRPRLPPCSRRGSRPACSSSSRAKTARAASALSSKSGRPPMTERTYYEFLMELISSMISRKSVCCGSRLALTFPFLMSPWPSQRTFCCSPTFPHRQSWSEGSIPLISASRPPVVLMGTGSIRIFGMMLSPDRLLSRPSEGDKSSQARLPLSTLVRTYNKPPAPPWFAPPRFSPVALLHSTPHPYRGWWWSKANAPLAPPCSAPPFASGATRRPTAHCGSQSKPGSPVASPRGLALLLWDRRTHARQSGNKVHPPGGAREHFI